MKRMIGLVLVFGLALLFVSVQPASAHRVYVGFGYWGPPLVIAPPPVVYVPPPRVYYAPPAAYYYYDYDPPRYWVPGHWERRWTPRGWQYEWVPGYWRYRY